MATKQAGTILRHLRRLVVTQRTRELSDGQLLQRFLASHDEGAFAALVERYGRLVWAVCRHVLRLEQDAEDAFQATFLILARNAASIRKTEALASWLHGTAHRVALRARRDAAIRRTHERRGATMPAQKAIPEGVLREALALLDEEVGRLPPKLRAAFVLCSLEGKSLAQAARQLDWKEGTVSGTLSRARRLLRDRLARRGVTLSAALAAVALGRRAAAALPPELAKMTVRAALGYAAGHASPTAATALAAGVVRTAVALPARTLTTILFVLALAATGAGLLAARLLAALPAPATEPAVRVEERSRADALGDPLPAGAIARLGTVRFRHGARIYSAVFAPDGKKLASLGLDGTVRLWDVATGQELHRFALAAAGEWYDTVSFSADGKRLAAPWVPGRGADSAVAVWDVVTGKELQRLVVKGKPASAIHFAPSGGGLVAVTGKTIRRWDAAGNELSPLIGHEEDIERIAYSPDGKSLASAARDRTLRLWDLTTGTETRRLAHDLTLAPDVELATPGFSARPRGILSLAFARDGKRLAVVSTGMQQVRLWDLAANKEQPPLQGEFGEIDYAVFLADGKTLATGGWDGSVRLWDLAGGKELRRFAGQEDAVLALDLSPDGKSLVVSGRRTLRLWDLAGKEMRPLAGHQLGVYRVAFSPDGRQIASGGGDRRVYLWDAATGQELHRLRAPAGMDVLTFTSDGKTLIGCAGWASLAQRWGSATGKEIEALGFEAPCRFFSSADGRAIAGWPGKDLLYIWDVATARKLHQFPLPNWSAATLSPDGIVACDTPAHDGNILLYDAQAGKEIRRLRGYDRSLSAIAFSLDGKTLAAAFHSEPRKIVLWETATGAKLAECEAGDRAFAALVFTPDGKMLASGGEDGAVRLWEVLTGRERHSFLGHAGAVKGLAFSPGGRRLASGSADTTALVWDVTGLGAPSGDIAIGELPALWTDLASTDAARAYRAATKLAGAPWQAVAFLGEHVRPAATATPARLARLVADLDSDNFMVRGQATRELEALAEVAEPALRRALDPAPSAEARRRVELLLEKLPLPASVERTRQYRALELLESIGTTDARRLLEELAGGAPEARLTKEARAAQVRLARRPGTVP